MKVGCDVVPVVILCAYLGRGLNRPVTGSGLDLYFVLDPIRSGLVTSSIPRIREPEQDLDPFILLVNGSDIVLLEPYPIRADPNSNLTLSLSPSLSLSLSLPPSLS